MVNRQKKMLRATFLDSDVFNNFFSETFLRIFNSGRKRRNLPRGGPKPQKGRPIGFFLIFFSTKLNEILHLRKGGLLFSAPSVHA